MNRKLVLAVAVLLPAALVAGAVAAAGGNAGAAILAGAAAVFVVAPAVAALLQLRRTDRRLARLEKATARAPRPSAPTAPAAKAAPKPLPDDVAGTVWSGRLPLPPQELRFMNETDDSLVATARDLTNILVREGMPDDADVLDVGSGYGRLTIGLMDREQFTGTYLGFDILKRHVSWCQKVMTAADPRFRFEHVDILNERYNAHGTVAPEEVPFPTEDASIDTVTLFSVFTHLYRPTIEHYLVEISRVLRPGGIAVGTWFLFDDDRMDAITSDAARYPMRFVLPDGSRYMSLKDPLHAISYRQSDVEAMARHAGLEFEQVKRGAWAGEFVPNAFAEMQDLVILRKPTA